jgi:hypothetical protein
MNKKGEKLASPTTGCQQVWKEDSTEDEGNKEVPQPGQQSHGEIIIREGSKQ